MPGFKVWWFKLWGFGVCRFGVEGLKVSAHAFWGLGIIIRVQLSRLGT